MPHSESADHAAVGERIVVAEAGGFWEHRRMLAEGELKRRTGRAGRARWVWWVLILLGVGGGGVWWVKRDAASTVLANGMRVRYLGLVHGEALPHSEFEEAVYAYSPDHFEAPGVGEILQRMVGQRSIPPPVYLHAPVLLEVKVGETDGRRFEGGVSLQDDFGASQSLNSRWSPVFCNRKAIPRRSAMLMFRIEESSGKTSGYLEFPNPFHQPKRAFVGQPAPVNAATPAGKVQLSQAVWKSVESPDWLGVELEFDVSQCAALLPCHVIGVRITDCWGNSELIQGAASQDGRTVRASWQRVGQGEALMQDCHWRVRLALSRGVGAKVPAGRTVVFESIPTGDSHFVQTRAIAAQRFMLNHRGSEKMEVENGMWHNFAYVQLPGASVDDWPVLTRVTGHLAGGGSEVFDPRKVREEFGQFGFHPIRVFNDAHGPTVAATTPTFDLRYWVPATYETVDLEFAIERPEVFEFDVQVAGWPEEARK